MPRHSPGSLPRLGSSPVSGAVSRLFYLCIHPCIYPCRASVVTSPVNEAVHRPAPDRRRSRARPVSGPGRAPGAPAPCGGYASGPTARLDNAFWPLHRRGLGAPGPAQGSPLWHHAPRWTRRTWAIHPAALSRLWRGVASRDQPPEKLCIRPASRRCTRLASRGWSRLTPVCRDSAAAQPVRRRWDSASRRLCLGTDPWVFRSQVAPSGEGGSLLVPVRSGDRREPHRRPGRGGGPCRLPRFGKRGCAARNVTLGIVHFLCTRRSLGAAVINRHPLNLLRAFP